MNGTASFIGPSITLIWAPGGSEGTAAHFRSAGITILWAPWAPPECCAYAAEARTLKVRAMARRVMGRSLGFRPCQDAGLAASWL